MNEEQIADKYIQFSFFSCIAVFISLVFFVSIKHLIEQQKI